MDIQSPATMQMGDANVITLQVTPQLLAQASVVRAELKILHFDFQDDGQSDKTVLENIPVSWSWVISPQTLGSQQFFLAVSYENQQGSWVRWQNIPLGIKVALPPSDTPTSAIAATVMPSITAPPPPADTSTPLPTVTATPTETNSQKLSNSFFSNPTAFLTILVTLILGVLGLIIQSRKQK